MAPFWRAFIFVCCIKK